MKSGMIGPTYGGIAGDWEDAPSSATERWLTVVDTRLAAAERLLERPELSRAAELVSHLEEACRALSAMEAALRADGESELRRHAQLHNAEGWARSARRLTLLTESASRFCEGWAAVIGAQSGYTAQGGQDVGAARGFRLDHRG